MLHKFTQKACSSLETVQNTYDLAIACKDIEGVFVECGVFAGSQIATMRYADDSRKIYAIDSYVGIPLASKEDYYQPGIGEYSHNGDPKNRRDLLKSSGISIQTVNDVRKTLRDWNIDIENIEFIKGWFQDTLPKLEIDKIALLRLDCDLYESYKVCWKYLYPKVVKGGYVIIDDFNLSGGRQAFNEYFADIDYQKEFDIKRISQNEVAYFQK